MFSVPIEPIHFVLVQLCALFLDISLLYSKMMVDFEIPFAFVAVEAHLDCIFR